MDNWVDNTTTPAILINDPNFQIYQQGGANANTVLQTTDWQAIPGTSTESQNTTVGNYSTVNNTYSINNGYITINNIGSWAITDGYNANGSLYFISNNTLYF